MILLASGSPRRAELLRLIGTKFVAHAVDLDETPLLQERPADYVERLAMEKAVAGWQRYASQTGCKAALGADTSVVLGGEILGKPLDREDHMKMLSALSGQQHEVISAVALTNGAETQARVVLSQVRIRPLTVGEIDAYWNTGEPQDKAGGYAIQGLGSVFIEFIGGSYTSVVGLPLKETADLFLTFGIDYWLREPQDE
jgi:septum formation protein